MWLVLAANVCPDQCFVALPGVPRLAGYYAHAPVAKTSGQHLGLSLTSQPLDYGTTRNAEFERLGYSQPHRSERSPSV